MKRKDLIFLTTYFVLLGLYLRDLMIYEAFRELVSFSSISQFISLALLALIVLYFALNRQTLSHKNNASIKVLSGFIIVSYIITLCWSISIPLGSHSTYIRIILPLFVLFFSYSIVQRQENLKAFFILSFILLILMLATYFEYFQEVLLFIVKDETVSNSSYFLLYLLPILLCTKKKLITIGAFVAVFIAVAMSAKRGGTIAFLAGLIIYLIINHALLKDEKNKLLKFWGVIILVLLIVNTFIGTILDGDFLIVNRLMEISDTGGSGRDKVWEKTLEMIAESDFPYFIMGHGYNQVVKDSPLKLSAHNDFLEIIYDYGIPVFFVYILFQIQMIKQIFKMIKESSQYAAPLAFSYATFLVNSMVSHIFIYPQYFIIYTFVWGSILGLYHRESKINSVEH